MSAPLWSAPSLSVRRWSLGLVAAVAAGAAGCDAVGSSKPEVVEVPASGIYAGSITIEKRSYAAGVRVDTRTCSAPVLIEIDAGAEDWFRMPATSCDLAGLEGEASVRFEPASGATATGTPMGLVSGSVPEMMWTGSFWSDGALDAQAETSVDGFGTRADWSLTLTAVSVDGAFDSGLDSGL